jgi:hypothetical protein
MLCVAYATLTRAGGLVAFEVHDFAFHPNDTGQALIRRGKADTDVQGRVAYLSRETVRWLKAWIERAGIREGMVFRPLIGRAEIGGPLNPESIAAIFKRVAQWIVMPERVMLRVSGHSTCVGTTRDLAALDVDLAAVFKPEDRKSARVRLQYAEKIYTAPVAVKTRGVSIGAVW